MAKKILGLKAAKFLIAENQIVNDGRVFIIHLRDPVIIAEAFHFDIDQETKWMEIKRKFTILSTVDYPCELIVLGAIFCAPAPEKWQHHNAQERADKLAKIMSRMGDWYYNYLKWEDEKEI